MCPCATECFYVSSQSIESIGYVTAPILLVTIADTVSQRIIEIFTKESFEVVNESGNFRIKWHILRFAFFRAILFAIAMQGAIALTCKVLANP